MFSYCSVYRRIMQKWSQGSSLPMQYLLWSFLDLEYPYPSLPTFTYVWSTTHKLANKCIKFWIILLSQACICLVSVCNAVILHVILIYLLFLELSTHYMMVMRANSCFNVMFYKFTINVILKVKNFGTNNFASYEWLIPEI